jgi:hypothetical protein
MGSFLISSALGFTIYQFVAWAFISDDRSNLRIGKFVVILTPKAVAWFGRMVGVVLIGLILCFGIWLHRPFIDLQETLGGTVILGFFFGPLLAIWTNTLLAKPSGEVLSTGEYVTGAALALLFLVGSVGAPAGDLLREYLHKITKISIGGAELNFTQKSSEANPLGGSLPLSGTAPTYASSSGAIGLEYLNELGSMIRRDREYLELFGKNEIAEDKSKLPRFDPVEDQKLRNAIKRKQETIEALLAVLHKSEAFVDKTIKRPVACLLKWYLTTGDAESVNRHIAGLADVFKRLPTIESGQPVDELAEEFVRQSFLIAADAVASVPSFMLLSKCDDVLQEFCPSAFREKPKRDDDELTGCLKELQFAARKNIRLPVFTELQQTMQPDLADFVKDRGWEARPYFVLGYASILSQLGQNQAASALLDSWVHPPDLHTKPVWDTAVYWFNVRVRSILVNFLEDWLTKEGQAAPTALRNEHIANLDSLRSDLKARLSRVDFFQKISSTLDQQSFEKQSDRLKEPVSCYSRDPDSDLWRRIFETYVTAELTYLKAVMSHPNYAGQFSNQATMVAARLAGMDLGCIPRLANSDNLFHPRAKTFYAKILDAFGTNVALYTVTHRRSDSVEAHKKRLSQALPLIEFASNMIGDVARNERDRNGRPFLERIAAGDAAEVEEKLKMTGGILKEILKKITENQE